MFGDWSAGCILIAAYFAVATIPLIVVDVREHRLPNAWTMPGWVAALAGCALDWLVRGEVPVTAFLCGAIALVLFGLFTVFAGMGMGDCKLAVPLAIGLGLLGANDAFVALFIAFMIGGLAALVLLIRCRSKDAQLAFGPYLMAGYWLSLLA